MAKYSAVKATVNAYIKQNGRKEITGRILNAVLNATIDSLGKYFQFAGGALPTDDPGTPDQNVCYLAGEPGVYTNFGGITIENEEVALLFWDGEWTKQRILIGIREVNASVDSQVGTPSVDVSYSGGELVLTFHNLKGEQGETGDPAGFGTIGADINGGVGTPGVSVETSGDNTAKNLMFRFTNLKGETGVTSVVATIDDTSGTPSCQVSLVGQQLTLAFSGLKGLKGDTGVSADYPITIYNGLDSDATDQALAAAQGKVLDGKVSQLGQETVKKSELLIETDSNLFDIENPIIESQGANITFSVSDGVMTIVNSGTNNQFLGLYLPDTVVIGKAYTLKVSANNAKNVILYKGVSPVYEILTAEGTEYSIDYDGAIGYWFRITLGPNRSCVVSSITLEEKNPDQYIKPELVKNIDDGSFSEEYREKQAQLFSNGNIFSVDSANIIGTGVNISYTKEGDTIKVVSRGSGQANNFINIGLPNTKIGKTYTLSLRATNTTGTMTLYRGLSTIVESVSAVNDVYSVVFSGGYDYLIKLIVSNAKTSIMSEFNLIDNEMAGKTFVNPKAMMYDNGDSTLRATLVNDAIDELDRNLQERIPDNEYNAQVNNRLANPLYETLEHYNTEHSDSPIVVEDVLVRGVIPAEARRYRIPTTIITNALTYLVAAEHRGNVVAGDATDASIHLARKEAGSNTWEYQNIIPFINYTTSYGRTYDPSFVIDRTGENTGVEGRIFLFGGMSTNDGSWLTDTEETNDLMYKYSDDDGETWSALVSVKSIVDYTKIDCILTSPNNGIQMTDGTLVVPCFCSLKTDGAFKCSTVLLIKENADSWKLSSITPSDFNIAECAIVETEDGKILLAARTTANFGAVNEETKYSFLWEYDVDSDTWEKKNSTFVENSGCQWSLTKAVFSINGTPTTVYIKSAVDSVNALRTNITIWASLDLNKWIRVYRVYAPAGNGYSVVDFYDDKMVVAYETSVDNYSISFQDISDVLDIVYATTENYLAGNVCIQDMLQYIINSLR